MRIPVDDDSTSIRPRDWNDLTIGILLLLASVASSAGLTLLARALGSAG